MERWFPEKKVRWTGTPVRPDIRNLEDKTAGPFTVLVLGGSLGSASLNRAFVEMISSLKGIRVVHQTGGRDFENIRQRYDRIQPNDLAPFFHDMPRRYQEADLIVARAGASTVAEVIATHRPAIFVPYPHSVNNHQTVNAERLVEAGGAEIITDEEIRTTEGRDRLKTRILYFSTHREELSRMADRLKTFKGQDSAESIAEDLIELGRGLNPIGG